MPQRPEVQGVLLNEQLTPVKKKLVTTQISNEGLKQKKLTGFVPLVSRPLLASSARSSGTLSFSISITSNSLGKKYIHK